MIRLLEAYFSGIIGRNLIMQEWTIKWSSFFFYGHIVIIPAIVYISREGFTIVEQDILKFSLKVMLVEAVEDEG